MRDALPAKREREIADRLSVAARDLADATDYVETYVARVELRNAWREYEAWHRARLVDEIQAHPA